MIKLHPAVPVIVLLATAAGRLIAQDFDLHGFVQSNMSLRAADAGGAVAPSGGALPDYLLVDERAQIEITRAGSGAGLLGRIDLFYDAVDERAGIDLREAYIDLTLGSLDIRTGRQIITWGIGDLVFINDIFPKDWTAFLSGRPLEYLKFGSDAVNVNAYPGFLSAQIIIVPLYRPDILPSGGRLLFYSPFPPDAALVETRPGKGLENTQFAWRIFRPVFNYDISVYFYRGFHPSPPGAAYDPSAEVVTMFHPRLHTYGASLQGPFLSGVISLEVGYYDSRDDRDGKNPAVENSQTRFLFGYQRAFGENFTAGIQYYGERMAQYGNYTLSLPAGSASRRQ
ncbi:MAG TPA: hypothetical protein VJO14_02055, partial [Bacteroidota bacterium]|nr:hypothetical protein [Bacteroidota bacterium]